MGLVALAVAGCGRTDPAAVPTSTAADPSLVAAAPVTPSSTTTPAPPEPVDDGVALADGRHAAYLTSIDVAAGVLVVDVIQFLTGDEARRASAADGKGAHVANDFYIRNASPRVRTVALAADAQVTVLDAVDPALSVPADAVALANLVAHNPATPYWLTVAGGRVVKVEQQYLP